MRDNAILQLRRPIKAEEEDTKKKALVCLMSDPDTVIGEIADISDDTLKTINFWSPRSMDELEKILSYPPNVISALSIGKSSIEGIGSFATGYVPTVEEAIEGLKKTLENPSFVMITQENALKTLREHQAEKQSATKDVRIEVPSISMDDASPSSSKPKR